MEKSYLKGLTSLFPVQVISSDPETFTILLNGQMKILHKISPLNDGYIVKFGQVESILYRNYSDYLKALKEEFDENYGEVIAFLPVDNLDEHFCEVCRFIYKYTHKDLTFDIDIDTESFLYRVYRDYNIIWDGKILSITRLKN